MLISTLNYGQNNISLHTSTENLLHTTTQPSVQESADKAEITSVLIFEQFTIVRIKFKSRGPSVDFAVPSNCNITDIYNSKNKCLITHFEDYELDKLYNIGKKGSESPFNLIFTRIAPGIELINVEIPSGNGTWGYSWKGVKINNPDDHPKTNWNENKLKAHWRENEPDLFDGIYESTTNTKTSSKYKLAVKKESNGYDLIYLSGADHLTWKAGDVKAFLYKSATPNLFKVKWYMSNKSPNENLLISFEAGIMKIVWSNPNGTKSIQDYLKLYPPSGGSLPQSSVLSGTGFALSSDGFIITNYHIIKNAKAIRISGINGDFSTTYSAKVIIEDKNNDLSIIKIDDVSFVDLGIAPYTFKKSNLQLGEDVYCLSYPQGAKIGDEVELTKGIISSKTGFQGDITSNQISVPVQTGNSGGPLLNLQGEIVGIINTKPSGTENILYAIKTNYLLNLIEITDSEIKLPGLNSISDKNLSSQIQLLKDFVYIIECE